ncbi:MAG: DNA translocase FtsK [Oscillospiraceae bacterium]|nr:DNA translocase FtsK [Oscillospiraceae bacterium]
MGEARDSRTARGGTSDSRTARGGTSDSRAARGGTSDSRTFRNGVHDNRVGDEGLPETRAGNSGGAKNKRPFRFDILSLYDEDPGVVVNKKGVKANDDSGDNSGSGAGSNSGSGAGSNSGSGAGSSSGNGVGRSSRSGAGSGFGSGAGRSSRSSAGGNSADDSAGDFGFWGDSNKNNYEDDGPGLVIKKRPVRGKISDFNMQHTLTGRMAASARQNRRSAKLRELDEYNATGKRDFDVMFEKAKAPKRDGGTPIRMNSDPGARVRMNSDPGARVRINSDPGVKVKTRASHAKALYRYPKFSLLEENKDSMKGYNKMLIQANETAVLLEEALQSFKVKARVVNISMGPSVTRYDMQPDTGVKVNTIMNLANDISLKLASSGVRIAPVADRSAVGIEVPNKVVLKVMLREILESEMFKNAKSKLAFAVGKDITGNTVVADIANMPHMLVAGATGSGKSVCINCLIMSLLFKSSPDDVKLIMIDPKVVELDVYNGIPHLMIPVVTEPKKAAGALAWAVQEMLTRYKAFSEIKVRDLNGYNNFALRAGGRGSAGFGAADRGRGEDGDGSRSDGGSRGRGEGNGRDRGGGGGIDKMPRLVIIIDELADLMMAAPKDVEDSICRLAQMGRAAGIHLVIATQRPSVDVITGVIKANIPSRIACAVASQIDSRTILDMAGAEKLLGRGDMLFNPVGQKKPLRVQGAFVSDEEVESVVNYVKSVRKAKYDSDIIEEITSASAASEEPSGGDNDELLPRAIEIVIDAGQASVSMLQRRLSVGYARAARIVDQMETRGIVSGFDGSKPRQILISKQQFYEMKF